jgi:hypothetical protein
VTDPPAGRPPIFVVGSPRSGTTLTRLVLDSHPGIACGPETHFLVEMEFLVRRHWHRLERYGQPKDYWYAKCRAFFGDFQHEYAASKGKPRWADKTPAYAQHLPFLLALFPEAQVVHVLRDAESVVASSLDRWGWRKAWTAAQTWVDSVAQAQATGATMSSEQYLEVRFEDLVGKTEATFRSLFAWLGEEWDPRVLDYDKQQHDESGRNRGIVVAARSAGGGAVDSARARRPRRRLDPLLRAHTQRVAGDLNRELGYG